MRFSSLRFAEIRQRLEFESGLDSGYPTDDELSSVKDIIENLSVNFHQPWYPIEADDEVDPGVELFVATIVALSEYFISLAPAEVVAEQTARELATRAVHQLETGLGSVVEVIALDGPRCSKPFTVDWLTVRPLTLDERIGMSGQPYHLLPGFTPRTGRPRVVWRYRYLCPRSKNGMGNVRGAARTSAQGR
jgi:hypothetical protein